MQTDYLVIGAGVVGLSIARRLALAGAEVVLIDSNPSFGMETSSRNSEVIHAGLYYPETSYKARFCVKGARQLYDYCAARGIKTWRCGKLIVAHNDAEIATLETLMQQGATNGVDDLSLLDAAAVKKLEPALHAQAAIHSPSSGVMDSHAFMAALEADAENHGALTAYQSRFVRAEKKPHGFHAWLNSQGEEMVLEVRGIINAAGHGAREVSHAIDAVNRDSIPPHYHAKGQYFSCTRKVPFQHLIYPIPSDGGLGIHLTRGHSGDVRFGPDIKWVATPSYDTNPDDAEKFYQSIAKYWHDIKPTDLVPAWAGLRPKIYPDGSVFQDFTIHDAHEHGCEGLIALYGIDSPGLTSSLAIADAIMGDVIPQTP